MTSFSADMNKVASRYAIAILDMATEQGVTEKIEQNFNELLAMVQGSDDLRSLIDNPLVGEGQKKNAILEIAAKAQFQDLTVKFLGVLADNQRLSVLGAVIEAFQRETAKQRGQVQAKVESAYVLSQEQTDTLQKELSKVLGSNVTLDVEVNKDLLGGMVVTVGSLMIDDSVQRKLERLQRTMSAESNTNQQLKEVG